MLPLKGITVIAIEQALAVPFATRQLADLGARVIKVERPGTGDFARNYDGAVNGMSSHFVWSNRSKESITLDLKSRKGKKVLDKLLESADILIQNLAPGALERMGYDPENLTKQHEQLIVCSVSGYGKDGPYEHKKAYDLLVQCEAGLVSITGSEAIPSKAGISIADIAAGMYAYSGMLTALFNREKTGKGTIINVSMLEALGEWMGFPMYYAAYGGEEPQRTGASHATIYPYGPFTCGDGKTVFIGLQNEREWEQFCKMVLKDKTLAINERFSTNTKRSNNRKELKELIERRFVELDSNIIIERLEKAKIANARLNSMKEFYNHAQLSARGRWQKVQTPNGEINALKPPAIIQGITHVMNPVPALGEDTDKILQELGLGSIK